MLEFWIYAVGLNLCWGRNAQRLCIESVVVTSVVIESHEGTITTADLVSCLDVVRFRRVSPQQWDSARVAVVSSVLLALFSKATHVSFGLHSFTPERPRLTLLSGCLVEIRGSCFIYLFIFLICFFYCCTQKSFLYK